jgi:hypothetical protein
MGARAYHARPDPRLKRRRRGSDLSRVATRDLSCPVCNADLPLAGDERLGDDVYCTYCGAVSILCGKPGSDPSTWQPEEDF